MPSSDLPITGPSLDFQIISLFPSVLETWMDTSILGRARKAGLFSATCWNLRQFALDKHSRVDDVSYGGGGGMVLKVEPLVAATNHIRQSIAPRRPWIVSFSPRGTRLNQESITRWWNQANTAPQSFVLVCGHYEGIDQRFIDGWVDEEISLGDFVVTGGEIAALAMIDALAREVEGTLGNVGAQDRESFKITDTTSNRKLLEYPQYTRPAEFLGYSVPKILLSGDHQAIDHWRMNKAREHTKAVRPDLLEQA